MYPLIMIFRYIDMKEKDSPETSSTSVPKAAKQAKPAGNRLKRHLHVIILGIVLILAAVIRVWAAPTSAGTDVAQFWAFARVFQAARSGFLPLRECTARHFPDERLGLCLSTDMATDFQNRVVFRTVQHSL